MTRRRRPKADPFREDNDASSADEELPPPEHPEQEPEEVSADEPGDEQQEDPSDAPSRLLVAAEPIDFVDAVTGKVVRAEAGEDITGRMQEKAAAKALDAGLLELS